MATIRLSVENVMVTHKNFSLGDVNFKLKSGDILGLVGRSGAGKSTLIKAMIGEKKQKYGTISIDVGGFPVSIKSVVGYSPQDNALFPYLTVGENLKLFAKLHKVNKTDYEERKGHILRLLSLDHHQRKKVTHLSGGMKKRADLAVALVHDPKIVILDEPFAGLDISLQKFFWKLIKELSSEGKIIIVSSHLLAGIQNNCNEFGLIHDGNYYNTNQIRKTIKKKYSLEKYLELIFEQK